jgi:very-short-patch-repair endonuclease
VEIDGEIHENQKEYDDGRCAEMERLCIKVIRFKNSEVKNNVHGVISKIEDEIKNRIKNPPWGI